MPEPQPDLPHCKYISLVRRQMAFGYFLDLDLNPILAARCPDILLDWFLMSRNVREDELKGYAVMCGLN